MNSQNNLEINGSLRRHSPAELLVEIARAQLNGSLRLANAAQKTVVYFDAGEAVFAVSNARRFRLFEMLLGENAISKEQLAAIPDFTNDLALRESLIKSETLSKAAAAALVSKQIEMILRDAFAWCAGNSACEGEWIFSPLVRIKGDVRFTIDVITLLIEHARSLPDAAALSKFKDLKERFALRPAAPVYVNLLPEEAFVFSRFETSALDVERAAMFSGLPVAAALRIVYTLWLAGFLAREQWDAPFSERFLAAVSSANLTLKKPEPQAEISQPKIKTRPLADIAKKEHDVQEEAAPREEFPLEKYLERIETAQNFYEYFALDADADAADIKRSYLNLAKRFHPDLFRKESSADKLRQVQDAFTKIAHAYETLKNEKTREVYDYKMHKELAQMKSARGDSSLLDAKERETQMKTERAAEDFENGFTHLMDDDAEEALQFFARAAHFAPDTARYRAYHGKTLAAVDARQKHKAEAEMQAAIRLEPDNADYRLMLAEFFVEMNLPKRAEGELRRLLSLFPHNRDAKILLDSVVKR